MIQFAHIIDDNLGDTICSPIHHFKFGECEEVSFRDVPIKPGPPLIVGAGGMLHPGVDEWIFEISKVRYTIVWGVGFNYYENYEENLRRVRAGLKNCAYVGIRDKDIAAQCGFDYVPGPTCMYKELDMKADPIRDVGVYEHMHHPIEIDYPRMNNKANKTLADVVKFLLEAKLIITNSYHGAYWARLLGREVDVLDSKSNRFSNMPTESLAECRALNEKFYNRFKHKIV